MFKFQKTFYNFNNLLQHPKRIPFKEKYFAVSMMDHFIFQIMITSFEIVIIIIESEMKTFYVEIK